MRLRELAASRVRFGYRRLTVMLRREGCPVNAKRIYRLYAADGLAVRTKVRKKIVRRTRVPTQAATRPNGMVNGFCCGPSTRWRWFRVLTVVDQFTRECRVLLADRPLSGQKFALALSQVIAERGARSRLRSIRLRILQSGDGGLGQSVRDAISFHSAGQSGRE
jgi:putative transposase